MAKYSISMPTYMPVDSVEHVIMNVNWIKKAVTDAGYSLERYHFESNFKVGELSCDCESEEELNAEALGQNAEFYTTNIIFFYDEKTLSFLFSPSNIVNEGKNLYISCNDKGMLSNVINNLRIHSQEKDDSNTSTIIINADGVNSSNIVIGSGNSASILTENRPTKRPFWKEIWAGILKNIIWVILVAVVLVTLAVLGITQPAWLKL